MSYGLGHLVALPFNKPEMLTMRLSVYLASLAFYHWAEYWYVCLFHYEKLHFDSKSQVIVITNRLLDQSESSLHADDGLLSPRRLTHTDLLHYMGPMELHLNSFPQRGLDSPWTHYDGGGSFPEDLSRDDSGPKLQPLDTVQEGRGP